MTRLHLLKSLSKNYLALSKVYEAKKSVNPITVDYEYLSKELNIKKEKIDKIVKRLSSMGFVTYVKPDIVYILNSGIEFIESNNSLTKIMLSKFSLNKYERQIQNSFQSSTLFKNSNNWFRFEKEPKSKK